jgi:hypothetical protein
MRTNRGNLELERANDIYILSKRVESMPEGKFRTAFIKQSMENIEINYFKKKCKQFNRENNNG